MEGPEMGFSNGQMKLKLPDPFQPLNCSALLDDLYQGEALKRQAAPNVTCFVTLSLSERSTDLLAHPSPIWFEGGSKGKTKKFF